LLLLLKKTLHLLHLLPLLSLPIQLLPLQLLHLLLLLHRQRLARHATTTSRRLFRRSSTRTLISEEFLFDSSLLLEVWREN
jgi:hypothetical protein